MYPLLKVSPMYRNVLPAVVFLLAGLTPLAGAAEVEFPEGTVVEAEDVKGADKYGNVVEDADASGDKAVTSGKEWGPVFRYELGDDLPEQVIVRVRAKGGPLQLKVRADGKNKELKWSWDKPKDYEWIDFGPYDREELGDRIELIRGKGDQVPHVDAVVISPAGGAKAATPDKAPTDTEPANAPEPGSGDVTFPTGTVVEAEDVPGADKFGHVVEDPDASGGKAVTSGKEWGPVFRHDLDADFPDQVILHVRRKGGPLQLKGRVDGKNKEIKWDWSKPKDYEWVKFGPYDREELGSKIEFIRGKGDQVPHIDVVVIAAAGGDNPPDPNNAGAIADTPQNAAEAGITDDTGGDIIPSYRPRAEAGSVLVGISIDWEADAGSITGHHWGMALFHPVTGEAVDDTPFVDFLASAKPGLVRIHRSKLGKYWMNSDKTSFDDGQRVWDQAAIARALAPVQALRDRGVEVELFVCLSDWPTWFSESKLVDPNRLDQAARIVSELVETAAATGVRVDGWELLNEADNTYQKADRLPDLWALFNVMAEAAREADPTTKIGGPSFTWANPEWVNPFLDACGSNLDFFSWHNYAGGKPTMPNEKLMAQVEKITRYAGNVQKALAKRDLSHVETYLTEFNIQWTWKPYERRHANNVGAAFQAAVITSLAAEGITGITMWHAKGNAYGLIDSDNRMRSTGQLYALSPWLQGRLATADFAQSAANEDVPGIIVVPIVRPEGGRSLLIINQSEATAQVQLPVGTADKLQHLVQIDADGRYVTGLLADDIDLPGWSVALLLDENPGLPSGRTEIEGQNITFDW